MTLQTVTTIAIAALFVGCKPGGLSGKISVSDVEPQSPPGAEPATRPDSGSEPDSCTDRAVGPAPIRRLTSFEFQRTVVALFGLSPDIEFDLPPEIEIDGFDNRHSDISKLRAEKLLDAAGTIASSVSARLDEFLPCEPSSADRACVALFIEQVGARAYRRPLAEDETQALLRVYELTAADSTTEEAVGLVVQAMLISPQFLFRPEPGDPSIEAPSGDLIALAGNEIATRLAFLFWASAPDVALLSAAAAGALSTPAGIEHQARRLLADARARDGLARFTDQWLSLVRVDDLEKDQELFPRFDAQLRDSMREESRRFIDDIVWSREEHLREIMMSNRSFVNGPLAALYGIPGIAIDSAWVGASLPAQQRRGFFTQASFLAATSHGRVASPVKRGFFIRTRVMCQDLPPPPNDVVVTIPEPIEGSTNRERFSRHAEDPACSGCHRLMDPIGFGFENFDAIGAYRDTDSGRPVDAAGELLGSRDADGPFNGALELIDRLAGSTDVEACLAIQLFRYAGGRREVSADSCSLDAVTESVRSTRGNLVEALVKLVQSDAFRFRQLSEVPEPAEPTEPPGPELNVRADGLPLASGSGLHDFGPIPVGRLSETVTFTIANSGGQRFELAASPVTLSGAGADAFELVPPATRVIEPGMEVTFDMRFAPLIQGPHRATVALNGTGQPVYYTFDVSGAGEAVSQSPPLFVAVGEAGRRTVSMDGVTWLFDEWTPGAEGDNDSQLRDVAFGDGLFVAVGGSQAGRILSTVDGAAWADASDGDGFLEGIAFGNGWWVAVGGNGRTIRSRDATTWVDGQVDYGAHFRGLAFGGARFVAIGDGGRRRASVDGLAWSNDVAGGESLRDVVYGDSRFIAVGFGGRRIVSLDGETWINDISGGLELTGIAYGNGRFVAVGGARSEISEDGGLTWTTHPGPPLNRVTFGLGMFVATGWRDRRFTSSDGITWQERANDDGPGFSALDFGGG